jgi:hypothetical protein
VQAKNADKRKKEMGQEVKGAIRRELEEKPRIML